MFGSGGVPVSFGVLNPSIVGDVDDDGVIPEITLFQEINELATGFIKPGAHGIILGDGNGQAEFFIGLEQSFGRVVRGMRKKYAVP